MPDTQNFNSTIYNPINQDVMGRPNIPFSFVPFANWGTCIRSFSKEICGQNGGIADAVGIVGGCFGIELIKMR